MSEQEKNYWEELLEQEGLGSIDEIEGFSEIQQVKESKKRVGNLLSINSTIEDVEEKYNVKIFIDFDNGSIDLYTKEGKLIGYIKKGFYTYGKVSGKEHLEKLVIDEYRGKGYGQIVFELYKTIFSIPKNEYSHKPSAINSLLKNGYVLSKFFDDNGEEIELNFQDIVKLEYELKDLIMSGDEDLPFTYKLTLQH